MNNQNAVAMPEPDEEGAIADDADQTLAPVALTHDTEWDEAMSVRPRRSTDWTRLFWAITLIGLTGLWIAALAQGAVVSGVVRRIDILSILGWIGLASGPLALIGIVWLLINRTSRREARRFGATAAEMRAEAERLEMTLARISKTLAIQRNEIATYSSVLVQQGEQTAARLAQVSIDMRDEADILARCTHQLNSAAAVARSDMGVLLNHLPDAETRAEALAEHIRGIGDAAREHSSELATRLAAITTSAQAADNATATASQRLGKELSLIEERSGNAARMIEETADVLSRSLDATLEQASRAIEETRHGVDAQREAMAAMISHARASIDDAGMASADALAERLEMIGTRLERFSHLIGEQDGTSRALVDHLDQALAQIEGRFATLGDTGTEQTADLAEAIVALSEHIDNVASALSDSMGTSRTLNDRANALRLTVRAVVEDIERDLPAAIGRIETDTARGEATIAAISTKADLLADAVNSAADRLADMANEGDGLLAQQRQMSANVAEEASRRLHALRDQTRELESLLRETNDQTEALANGAAPHLLESLLRVRETAKQAAAAARETLQSVIPEAAEALAREGATAIGNAFDGRINERIAAIAATADEAVSAASKASEKLSRQMTTIAETTAAIEARLAEAKDATERDEEEHFARRVSLLIESLNSAAIDVAKILSNEVTDSAWAAYLRGDRGVFTRRAVRLLDSGEARDISRHYENEPEFREQVNRYVHDFEAMLRRILASRDGSPLSVTMLSSDMGKLYVALAQAIERLRV